MSKTIDFSAGGQDVAFVQGLTEHQCKKLVEKYPDGCDAAYFKDRNPTECYIHRFGTPNKSSYPGVESWDRKEVADKQCPYGHRYRDHCLVFNNNPATYNDHHSWCKSMGGKLTMYFYYFC